MIDNERFRFLFKRYAAKTADTEEITELFQLIKTDKYNKLLDELIDEFWIGAIPEWIKVNDHQKARDNYEAIQHRIKLRKVYFFKRISVAAAVLIVISVGGYFLFNKNSRHTELAKAQPQRFKNDVEPGKYKAKLTLADGTVIVLDSAKAGTLTIQGGTVLTNHQGQLVYERTNSPLTAEPSLMNTLSTAKGETYATVLQDGTKVWMNSASSIKFPVAFTGNERRVEIIGEAYFEVARDVSKPFYVTFPSLGGGRDGIIEVLGTHFNINSYSDEPFLTTTLLEGSIRITGPVQAMKLSAGQQVQMTSNGEINLVRNADVDRAIAWKNGLFDCNGLDVAAIMRQVARWYNVEVRLEPGLTGDKFVGRIPRTVSLANLLKVLELNGVRFTIDGRKITVMK